jgi:hypothetical protein
MLKSSVTECTADNLSACATTNRASTFFLLACDKAVNFSRRAGRDSLSPRGRSDSPHDRPNCANRLMRLRGVWTATFCGSQSNTRERSNLLIRQTSHTLTGLTSLFAPKPLSALGAATAEPWPSKRQGAQLECRAPCMVMGRCSELVFESKLEKTWVVVST